MSDHHETKREGDVAMDNLVPNDNWVRVLGGRHRHTSPVTELEVAAECGPHQLKAEQIECRAQLARQALANVAMLTKDEEDFIQTVPLGESRYKAIVDAYAIYAVWEISGLQIGMPDGI